MMSKLLQGKIVEVTRLNADGETPKRIESGTNYT